MNYFKVKNQQATATTNHHKDSPETNTQGTAPTGHTNAPTKQGTETHHQRPQRRTTQNGKPKSRPARRAAAAAEAAEPNQRTQTQAEKDLAEARTATNRQPKTKRTTSPGTGAQTETGEAETNNGQSKRDMRDTSETKTQTTASV